MWGLIMPYVNSYLRLHHDFEPYLINLGSSALYLGDYLGSRKVYIELCYLIYKRIGLNTELIFAILITCLGYGVVAVNSNPYMVIIVDNLLVGFGCGVLNICTFWPLWSHFESTNATITGIVVVGYSFGATIYANIFTQVVNPDNLTPPPADKSTDQIYPDSVSERVPTGFLVFTLMTFVIGFVSMIMIKSKPKTDSETEDDIAHNKSYKEILLSYDFWRLFVIFYLNYFIVIFLVCDYRVLMLKHISNDHLISYASSIATVASNLGRFIWMVFLDYTSFKTLLIVINSSIVVLLFTIPLIWNYPTLLITWISGIWFFSSSIYPSFIVETYRVFPGDSGKKAYPILTLPWTLATFTMVGITAIGDSYDYIYVMYILIASSLSSTALLFLLPTKIQKPGKEEGLYQPLITIDKKD
jgi:hypothetical protein